MPETDNLAALFESRALLACGTVTFHSQRTCEISSKRISAALGACSGRLARWGYSQPVPPGNAACHRSAILPARNA
jgi:hypothetical protein